MNDPAATSVSATAREALEVLTADQVCVLLKIKKSWLYDQVEKHDFPAYQIGRQLRFRIEEVEQWLQDRRRIEREAHVQTLEQPRRGRPRKK